MKTRDIVNAVIGIWFILAPWMLGFSYDAGATSSSIVFGILQVIMSSWGANKPGWNSWQNWIVVYPFSLCLFINRWGTLVLHHTWVNDSNI